MPRDATSTRVCVAPGQSMNDDNHRHHHQSAVPHSQSNSQPLSCNLVLAVAVVRGGGLPHLLCGASTSPLSRRIRVRNHVLTCPCRSSRRRFFPTQGGASHISVFAALCWGCAAQLPTVARRTKAPQQRSIRHGHSHKFLARRPDQTEQGWAARAARRRWAGGAEVARKLLPQLHVARQLKVPSRRCSSGLSGRPHRGLSRPARRRASCLARVAAPHFRRCTHTH